ncbi:Uncharacterised protein [Serratia proteamaculans]|uniref:DUF2971 domain-containing protein n=1 Tax=Serratia proteamaculans TaxID=28151 RepID=A0ABS0TNE4_SERPR|nr:hypothetical protein [Serratia proteamaculans]MBI6179873.1 hypothetical protein [Serratia proteamaculans]RYM53370.1 hypothetical protein BSQ97_10400 [Serratia proteamaculans]CAI2482489.1 Uncharacterised protein [Serratia proteamaculans]
MISEDNNCYTRLYKRKIENDFGAEFLNSLGVSDRLFPLVYICLKHRRIPPLKRKVFVASKIEKDLLKNNRWTLLKSRIESGEDINNYISKKTRNWYEYDFLLYSCNIYHIHLRSSIKGGVGDELIYAIFQNESIYVINYGGHHDIFKPGELVEACENEWPGVHFDLEIDDSNSSTSIDNDFFKENACNPRLGFNLLKPAAFTDKKTGKMKYISNHKNTAMISYECQEGTWKLPLKCVMAFDYEEKLMRRSMQDLHSHFGTPPDSLELDLKNREYIFKVPTIRGYGDYIITKQDAPRQLTASFPCDEAEINWQL